MKKTFLILVSCLLFTALTLPSFAVVTPFQSWISNDQIMTNLMPQGKMDVSAKLEYWTPDQEYIDNTQLVMQTLKVNKSSYTEINIPVRLSYGITNALSVRVTLQFTHQDIAWTNFNGRSVGFHANGLGDSGLEFLYKIKDETADKPSCAVNVGMDILSGTSAHNLPNAATDTSLDTGLVAPSYYISGIFGKKMGAWNGKALIGYVITSPDKNGSSVIDPADVWMLSYAMSTAASDSLDWGGEISAKFTGEDNLDIPRYLDTTDFQARSPISRIAISPFVQYKQSDKLSWKGVVEIPLLVRGSTSQYGLLYDQFSGIGVTVGGEYHI